MRPFKTKSLSLQGEGAFRTTSRSGVATLVVLLLVSMALALSYAVVRSQGMAVQIQENSRTGACARQSAVMAAARGMDLAIRRMKTSQWQGVDVPFGQALSAYERFEVTFATGDDALTHSDPSYAEWPYRVTLVSTGYASDPSNPRIMDTHRLRAVVRLVPRRVADPPSGWDDVVAHTVCQWTAGQFSITVPFRIEGPVRVRDSIDLTQNQLNWADDARRSYLEGLTGMWLATPPAVYPVAVPSLQAAGAEIKVGNWSVGPGAAVVIGTKLADLTVDGATIPVVSPAVGSLQEQLVMAGDRVTVGQTLCLLAVRPDRRPFTGPVDLSFVPQRYDTVTLLSDTLRVATRNTLASSLGWTAPASFPSYRLYPGGKSYNVGSASRDLIDTVLEPDPPTNPLGIFTKAGECYIHRNVTIRGTLLTTGGIGSDIEIRGQNNQVLPLDLPPFNHPDIPAEARVRLPGLVSADDVFLSAGSQLAVNGLVLCTDDFWVLEDHYQGTSLTLQGKLVTKDFYIQRRTDWPNWHEWWQWCFSAFGSQENLPGGIRWFPEWLFRQQGLNLTPRLVIRPDTASARYHCQIWSSPIFVPHPDDGGLRWELLEWTDSP